MTGGMLPQRDDTLTVIELVPRAWQAGRQSAAPIRCRAPKSYELADFRVLGEAEGHHRRVRRGLECRAPAAGRSRAKKFQVDVTKSPIPRFDLINFQHYLYVGVQFSRGCPFNCEFCDIIELYGRVPRVEDERADAGRAAGAVRRGLSRPRRFRRRQPDRQQEGAEALPSRAHDLAARARLSVRVLDRSLDQPGRRRAAARHDEGGELLRRFRRHREPGHRDPDRDAEEAEHPAQPRRERAQDLRRRDVRHRRLHRRLRHAKRAASRRG